MSYPLWQELRTAIQDKDAVLLRETMQKIVDYSLEGRAIAMTELLPAAAIHQAKEQATTTSKANPAPSASMHAQTPAARKRQVPTDEIEVSRSKRTRMAASLDESLDEDESEEGSEEEFEVCAICDETYSLSENFVGACECHDGK